MYQLNLPEFEYTLKKANGKVWIFDVIRKKFVVITPEEWVRQHLINLMINVKHYPKSLIKVETGLHYNQLAKRSDIVVHARNGAPWMVVECKAPTFELNERSLIQASTYNATLRANYLVITNGIRHLIHHTDWSQGVSSALTDFPDYDQQT